MSSKIEYTRDGIVAGGVCEAPKAKRIKTTIQPHQVFIDEIKNLINAFFINNNHYDSGHFFYYGGIDAGYRNLVNHNKEYGKYIIDRIESIKHLIEPDAEFNVIDLDNVSGIE